jgi:protease I
VPIARAPATRSCGFAGAAGPHQYPSSNGQDISDLHRSRVVLAGEQAGHVYKGKHSYPCKSDAALNELRGDDFAGIVIPGGWMPDKLRRNPNVLELTRHFATSGKMVASICHGPWIMISAGVCRGVRMTSTPGIKDDLVNAGAIWSDEEVVIDRNFVTSRRPPDLPALGLAMIQFLTRH